MFFSSSYTLDKLLLFSKKKIKKKIIKVKNTFISYYDHHDPYVVDVKQIPKFTFTIHL